jgi:histidine triad (HIT) family protein
MNDFYCEEVLTGHTPVKKVLETENVLAFYHTKPYWPVHIVVIPKIHIDSLLTLNDNALLEELFKIVKKIADSVTKEHGSCRILTNVGGYQDSKHLHWHISFGEPIAA